MEINHTACLATGIRSRKSNFSWPALHRSLHESLPALELWLSVLSVENDLHVTVNLLIIAENFFISAYAPSTQIDCPFLNVEEPVSFLLQWCSCTHHPSTSLDPKSALYSVSVLLNFYIATELYIFIPC